MSVVEKRFIYTRSFARLRPLQLLLPDCVRFSCSSPIASASTAAPDCVRFSCCPRLCPLQLLLPNCVRFNCCSLIASASTAAPRLRALQLLLPDCVRFSCPVEFWKVPTPARAFTEFEVRLDRAAARPGVQVS